MMSCFDSCGHDVQRVVKHLRSVFSKVFFACSVLLFVKFVYG